MFSPYMMLHVLFFLGPLWDVKGAELNFLSGFPTVALHNGHFRLLLLVHLGSALMITLCKAYKNILLT